MEGKIYLTLAHQPSSKIEGNGGYHVMPVDSGEVTQVEVESLKQAVVQFCGFVGRNGLSGHNLPENSGEVCDDAGTVKYRVLFNGSLRSPCGEVVSY